MSNNKDIVSLQVIAALDSLSYGLLYCFLPVYLLSLGANNMTLGYSSVGILLAELVSQDVVEIFIHSYGKKFSLFFIFNLAAVTHLLMVLTTSCTFTILVRMLFSSTNQSQSLCRQLLLSKARNDKQRECLQSNYSYLSGMGYIVGPIISGYMFHHGFGYTCVLAAMLCSVNSALLLKVQRDQHDGGESESNESAIEKAVQKLILNIENFIESDVSNNWDLLVTKYLFSGSIIIFFSKFPQLLRANYKASYATVGYTLSFINTVIFAGTYIITISKSELDKYPVQYLIEIAFFLMTIFMLLACFAPYYVIFLLLLVPIIFLRSFIVQSWQDLFAKRKNESLSKINNAISVCAGMTIPILFGMTANAIAYRAVILFATIPVALCWILTKWYSKNDDDSEDEDSKKDN